LLGKAITDRYVDFCRLATGALPLIVSRPIAAHASRGLAYWQRRPAAAVESNQPDRYRTELGVVSQWCFHGQVDEAWLCEQLLSMLGSGFAPTDAFSVVEWLGNIAALHVDRAVEVMAALLRHPRVDQWVYMTQREPIRVVFNGGLARGTPATIQRVQKIIGFLSTLGEALGP
jgi:hypothetical protein